MKRLKILMSAYACEPGKGSEPGVGWNLVWQVSQHHQVWVLTSNSHRQGIEAELARKDQPNLHFVYFDPLGWTIDWSNESKGVPKGVYFQYYLWQIWAYFVGRSLHREINFDIAHHVTYVKHSSPSFLALLPVPFVWGPVGGGESAPKAFWKDFSPRGRKYETLRNLARWLGEQDPFVRLTAKRSIMAWATTEDTAKRLHQIGVKNVQVYSQLGLSKEEIDKFRQYKMLDDFPIRFISIGRLLHWKGFHLGLAAFAQANIPNAEYWIVGDGPEREELEKVIEDINITGRVKFWGSLSRHETLNKLGASHVLVHPSLHESGGGVCLEAMAVGRPVICLDLGGPAVQVTNETGLKIPAHTPGQAVRDLALAMKLLAENPEMRTRLGQAGQKRVSEAFSWEKKGQQVAQLYEKIASSNHASLLPSENHENSITT